MCGPCFDHAPSAVSRPQTCSDNDEVSIDILFNISIAYVSI
jgi:hypothetical protein